MIALGGVIGAGLIVGSGAVIGQTGPAAVLSYILTGVLIVPLMRLLGEMASANPTAGSFTELIRSSLGGAGFTSGWLYWYFWVIVVGFEAFGDRWEARVARDALAAERTGVRSFACSQASAALSHIAIPTPRKSMSFSAGAAESSSTTSSSTSVRWTPYA